MGAFVAELIDDEMIQRGGEGARFYYELARTELDRQIAAVDALDRKLSATFTLSGALIALIAVAFTFRESTLSPGLWGILAAIAVMFVLNSISIFFAYRLRRWNIGPDLVDFSEFAVEYELDDLIEWVASEIQESCEENERTLREKAAWVRLATGLTLINLCLAAVGAVVATWPW